MEGSIESPSILIFFGILTDDALRLRDLLFIMLKLLIFEADQTVLNRSILH